MKTMPLSEIQEALFAILAEELSVDQDKITLETCLKDLGPESLDLLEAETRVGEYFEVSGVLDSLEKYLR